MFGEKGRYFRIYAGGLKDIKAARDLCVALKTRKVYFQLSRRAPADDTSLPG